MQWLGRQQMFDIVVLVLGLIGSFAVMSAHHPYTATILSMVAAVVVAGHIVLVARTNTSR